MLAGEGLAVYGLTAAVLVIGANLGLRPIVRAINRHTVETSEEEQRHVVSIECHAARACETRAELVQDVADVPDLHFNELDSAFLEDVHRVEVTATVTSNKRRELAVEAIVGRFAEMEGVSNASWRLISEAS